jgi:predicted nicotinamide N-methyase
LPDHETTATPRAEKLSTSAGEFELREYRLRVGSREWSILHTDALITWVDEQVFLGEQRDRIPYGAALWPSSIALAHEIAERADEVRGKRILELGAGTGLPGIVAASLGARVTQTDKHDVALHVCRRNGERNRVPSIDYRAADWAVWDDTTRYDWIIGGDILYAEGMHEHLRVIFERNLSSGGRVLIADPFRQRSFQLLESMEAAGWEIGMSQWTIGEGEFARRIGVFELVPPA